MPAPDLLLTFTLLATGSVVLLAVTWPAALPNPLRCGLAAHRHTTTEGATFCRAMRPVLSE